MLEIRGKMEEQMLKEITPKAKLHKLKPLVYEPMLINGNDLIINWSIVHSHPIWAYWVIKVREVLKHVKYLLASKNH